MRPAPIAILLLPVVFLMVRTTAAEGDWQPANGPLMTRWSADLEPDRIHAEYPRPQLQRKHWTNLNGVWEFAAGAGADEAPPIGRSLGERILVPFPIESALSGIMRPMERAWYRRTFRVDDWLARKQRVLLHFGAVDWEARVWVNGKSVGLHRGGYDAFSFDITDALLPEGEQELVVGVYDPTDQGTQPRGKQVRKPVGIWYTPTTGIWQTAWLEPVPPQSIQRLRITPDLDAASVRVEAVVAGEVAGLEIEATALDGGAVVGSARGAGPLVIPLSAAKPWSPDRPFLYGLKVQLMARGDVKSPLDEVESYFGLRKISLGRDARGITRLMLNNAFVFQYGPLDQGFWPDGLYTAPSDEALRFDVHAMKQLGFNMVRKHVKIEPSRWYHWCDKLGLLVWQDMPSGDKYIGGDDPDIARSEESATQYFRELDALIDGLGNHPSIVMWVPFNEGWGQFDTARVVQHIREMDPTRLVNNASGWTDRNAGDVIDIHVYPGPGAPNPEPDRAAVLGEFGGLGLPLEGHTWQGKDNWGYRSYKNKTDLAAAYEELILGPAGAGEHRVGGLAWLIAEPGLSAAVYTQLTDVEIEVNGLLTYDRAEFKIDPDRLARVHRRLLHGAPAVVSIVETSRDRPAEWRLSESAPPSDWTRPGFDDRQWKLAPAGFGTAGTPGAVVRTHWGSPEIWLRRKISIPAGEWADPHLLVHHDEDVEVYLDGALALARTGFTVSYMPFPVSPEARSQLTPGEHELAVHCRQTGGGQYVDVGLIDLRAPSRTDANSE